MVVQRKPKETANSKKRELKSTLEWARYYVYDLGFSVIPLGRDKRPAFNFLPKDSEGKATWEPYQTRKNTDEELARWFGNGKYNIGILTGKISGITVVDLDSLEAAKEVGKKGIPPTPIANTSRGHSQFFFKYHPDIKQGQRNLPIPDTDIRNDGGYVMAVPSIHPSGETYRWIKGFDIRNTPLAEAPQWLVDMFKGNKKEPRKMTLGGAKKGERDQEFFDTARKLWGAGLSKEDLLKALKTKWEETEQPFKDKFTWKDVLKKVDQAEKYVAIPEENDNIDLEALIEAGKAGDDKTPLMSEWDGLYSGFAKDFAEKLAERGESPMQFFYMIILTYLGALFARRLRLMRIRKAPRFFTLLVGPSGFGRKSEAIQYVSNGFKKLLVMADWMTEFRDVEDLSSAEGIGKILEEMRKEEDGDLIASYEMHGYSLLLRYDELQFFMNKVRVQGSALKDKMNTLADNTTYEHVVKEKWVKYSPVYLSLITACTEDLYLDLFNSNDVKSGFLNRFFIVWGKGQRKISLPEEPDYDDLRDINKAFGSILKMAFKTQSEDAGDMARVVFSEDAKKIHHEWYMSLPTDDEDYARVDTYALKLLPLLAINEGKMEIDKPIVERAIKMAELERKIRHIIKPVIADNPYARMEQKILRALEGCALTKRDLYRKINAQRASGNMFKWGIDSLKALELIKEKDGYYYKVSSLSSPCHQR